MCDECDELKERVEELEEMVDALRFAAFGGNSVESAKTMAKAEMPLAGRVRELEEGDASGGADEVVSVDVRDEALPIHRRLFDRKHGDGQDQTGRVRRGVYFFQRFIHKLDPDETMVGIEGPTNGRYKLTSKRAEEILRDNGEPADDSNHKKRAMKAVVERSKPHEDAEPMFRFENKGEYVLSVDADEWEAYMERIASTAQGVDVRVETTDADDGEENSSETTPAQTDKHDLDDEWNKLHQAEVAQD